MMELCKSDTDDENSVDKEQPEVTPSVNDNTYDELVAINVPELNTSNIEENEKNNVATDASKIITSINGELQNIDHDATDIAIKNSDINLISMVDNNIEDGSANIVHNSSKSENIPSVDNLDENMEKNTSSEMELVYNDSVDDTKTEDEPQTESEKNEVKKNQDGVDINKSTEMELVYNDSIEDKTVENNEHVEENVLGITEKFLNIGTEDSQQISLQFDSEPLEKNTEPKHIENEKKLNVAQETNLIIPEENNEDNINNDFSDDDVNMMDIDALIENAEIIASKYI